MSISQPFCKKHSKSEFFPLDATQESSDKRGGEGQNRRFQSLVICRRRLTSSHYYLWVLFISVFWATIPGSEISCLSNLLEWSKRNSSPSASNPCRMVPHLFYTERWTGGGIAGNHTVVLQLLLVDVRQRIKFMCMFFFQLRNESTLKLRSEVKTISNPPNYSKTAPKKFFPCVQKICPCSNMFGHRRSCVEITDKQVWTCLNMFDTRKKCSNMFCPQEKTFLARFWNS